MSLIIDRVPMPSVTLSQLSMSVTSPEAVGQVVGPLFDRVTAAYATAGAPVGTGVAWYDWSQEPAQLGVGFDTPLADPEAAGLTSLTLPAVADAVVARYIGPIQGIGAAWGQVHAWFVEHGLTPKGICREVYVVVDHDGGDWTIELQQPIG